MSRAMPHAMPGPFPKPRDWPTERHAPDLWVKMVLPMTTKAFGDTGWKTLEKAAEAENVRLRLLYREP